VHEVSAWGVGPPRVLTGARPGPGASHTAVLIADGGRALTDLATLRDQAELYGPVASDPTLWRTLDEIDEAARRKIARARARTRAHVWSLIEVADGFSERYGDLLVRG
jgi:hypothetical protein